jgi:hypothetical protein
MRDFHDWQNLVKNLQTMGFKVFVTAPRAGGVEDLPCEESLELLNKNRT